MTFEMAMDLAKKFCSKDKTRPKLMKPVVYGRFVYASNGRSAIRITLDDAEKSHQDSDDFARRLADSINDFIREFDNADVGHLDSAAVARINADFDKKLRDWRICQELEMREQKRESRHTCPLCHKEFFDVDGDFVGEDYFEVNDEDFRFPVVVCFDHRRLDAQIFDCTWLIPAIEACGEGAHVFMKERIPACGRVCGRILIHRLYSEIYCVVNGMVRVDGELTDEEFARLECKGVLAILSNKKIQP